MAREDETDTRGLRWRKREQGGGGSVGGIETGDEQRGVKELETRVVRSMHKCDLRTVEVA